MCVLIIRNFFIFVVEILFFFFMIKEQESVMFWVYYYFCARFVSRLGWHTHTHTIINFNKLLRPSENSVLRSLGCCCAAILRNK